MWCAIQLLSVDLLHRAYVGPGLNLQPILCLGVRSGAAKGCDRLVGERGIGLSDGQRQRIGPVLCMDEATSALDNTTEHSVIKTINALEGDRTIIVFCNTVKLGFKGIKLGLRCLLQADIQ